MRRLFIAAMLLLCTATGVLAQDYFVYSQLDTGSFGSYGPAGFVGDDGVSRIIYYSGSTAHILKVSIPDGMDANTHPNNPAATGPIAPRTFTEERTFDLGAWPGHESEFHVADKGKSIYLGASVGVRKYVFDQSTNSYVYIGNVAPPSPIEEGYSTQSLAYDSGTNLWYAGSISWNNDPGVTERHVWKYDANNGPNGQWQLAFNYTTLQSGSHHDGMEMLNGHLFLADYMGDYIYEYTTDGTLLNTYTHEPLQHELEGMGFGALQHFWCGSHGSAITEFGGGAIQEVIKNNPPQAEAGAPITISTSQIFGTSIMGSVSDPDADALTCRWLMGDQVLRAWQQVDASAGCPLPLAGLFTSMGTYVLTLEAQDVKGAIGRDQMTLTIGNAAPVGSIGGAGTFELGTNATLTGMVSDPEGDIIQYRWLLDGVVFASSSIVAQASGQPTTLPPFAVGALGVGPHTVSLQVKDPFHIYHESVVQIIIIDQKAPTITATADQGILWPPDHTMQPVTIHFQAQDNSGQVTVTASAWSSEPDNATGDGSTHQDVGLIEIDPVAGTVKLSLRAERSGTGAGRTYTVLLLATDANGNSSTATASIMVPHDMKQEVKKAK